MRSRQRPFLILCLALAASSFAGCQIKDNRVDIKDNKVEGRVDGLEVKVGGVDVTVKIGEAEEERAELSRQLGELNAQLAAKETLHAQERAKLQEQQLALQQKLLTITEQLATLRQGDAGLRQELERMRGALRANSEELKLLRQKLAEREAAPPSPATVPADPDDAVEPADEAPVSFAILENITACRISFGIVAEDGSLEAESLGPREQLVLEQPGDGIEIDLNGRRLRLNYISRAGSGGGQPADSELPVNHLDFDDEGRLELFFNE